MSKSGVPNTVITAKSSAPLDITDLEKEIAANFAKLFAIPSYLKKKPSTREIGRPAYGYVKCVYGLNEQGSQFLEILTAESRNNFISALKVCDSDQLPLVKMGTSGNYQIFDATLHQEKLKIFCSTVANLEHTSDPYNQFPELSTACRNTIIAIKKTSVDNSVSL